MKINVASLCMPKHPVLVEDINLTIEQDKLLTPATVGSTSLTANATTPNGYTEVEENAVVAPSIPYNPEDNQQPSVPAPEPSKNTQKIDNVPENIENIDTDLEEDDVEKTESDNKQGSGFLIKEVG